MSAVCTKRPRPSGRGSGPTNAQVLFDGSTSTLAEREDSAAAMLSMARFRKALRVSARFDSLTIIPRGLERSAARKKDIASRFRKFPRLVPNALDYAAADAASAAKLGLRHALARHESIVSIGGRSARPCRNASACGYRHARSFHRKISEHIEGASVGRRRGSTTF